MRERRGQVLAGGLLTLALVALVVLRLRLRHRQLTLDESGYLTVARQWHGAGRSLYTNYFLDRPPLLVVLFQAGNAWAGPTGLRYVGLVAAVVAAAVVAVLALRLAGVGAATVAGLIAVAFLVSPSTGAPELNGELLAAPFVAVGIAAVALALTAPGRRALLLAALAGVAGAAAILVKQNMLDVVVFGAAAAVLASSLLGWRRVLALGAAFVGGAIVTGLAVLALIEARGTGPRGVLFAMYHFRLEASHVLAGRSESSANLGPLLLAFVGTGLALGVALALVHAWPARRRRDITDVVVLALVVTLVFDAVSIGLGQQYWRHYLVQLVVPVSLAAGLAFTRLRWVTAAVTAFAVVSAAASTYATPDVTGSAILDHKVGAAVRRAADRHDTIVTFQGHGDVTYASRLASPYPYLWRLQAETLDPRLDHLVTILDGRGAPTWVVWFTVSGLDRRTAARVRSALRTHYQRVTTFKAGTVWLRDGVSRPPLRLK